MKKIFFLCVFVPAIVFASPQQLEFMLKLNSGTPHLKRGVNKIPFQLNGHKIYIKTVVDTSREFNFILDTGAITIIDEDAARELGLENGTRLSGMDTTKAAFISKNAVTVKVGDVSVEKFIPLITDLPDADVSEPCLDGFIGSDFLRFFCVTIDYQKQELVISSERPDPASLFYTAKMKKFFPLGFPMIDCRINDVHSSQLMLDTGSPFSLVCPISMIEDDSIFADQPVIKSTGAFMKWPATTTDYNYLTYAQTLQFGDFTVNDFPVYCAELPQQLSSGLIGKQFLQNFITILDYPNNEIVLVPVRDTGGDELFATGFVVAKDNGKTVIKAVWQTSSADEQGIAVGDEIITINGYAAADLSLAKIDNILNDNNIHRVSLQIRNNEGTRTIVMNKSRLIEYAH